MPQSGACAPRGKRHKCGALWHHARECPEPDSGDGQWRDYPHRPEHANRRQSYDPFTHLLVGSERHWASLPKSPCACTRYPKPSPLRCAFADLHGAVQTAMETIQAAVPVARIELLNSLSIQAVNQYSKLGLPETTFVSRICGSPQSVAEQSDFVNALATDNGGKI